MARFMSSKSILVCMAGMILLPPPAVADHPAVPDATYELDVTLQANRAIGAGFGQTFLGRTALLSVKVNAPDDYWISSIAHRERDGNSFWAAEFNKKDLPLKMVEYRAYNIHRDADHAVGFSGTLTTYGIPGEKTPHFDLAVADLHLQHHEKIWRDGSGLVLEPTIEGDFGETIGPNEGDISEFAVITQWGGGARSQVGTVTFVPPKGVAIYTHNGAQRLAYTDQHGITHVCNPYAVPPEGAKATIRIVANEAFDGDGVVRATFTWDSDIEARTESTAEDYVRVLSLPQLKIVNTPKAVFVDAESSVPLFFEVEGADKITVLEAVVTLNASDTAVIYKQPIPLTHVVPGDAVSTFDGGNTNAGNGDLNNYTLIIDRDTAFATFTSSGPRRVADQNVHYELWMKFEYNGNEYIREAGYPIQFVADKTVKAVQLGQEKVFAATDTALYYGGQHLSNFDGNPYVARNFPDGLRYCYPIPPNSYEWVKAYSTYPHALGTLTDYWTSMERQVTGPSGAGAPDANGLSMRAKLHRHWSHPNSSIHFSRTGVMGVERGAHFAITYPRKTFSFAGKTYGSVVDKRHIQTASMTSRLFEDATVDLTVNAESATGWDAAKLSGGGIGIAAGTLAVYTAAGPVGWVLGAATISGGVVSLLDAVVNPTVDTVAYAGVYGVYAIHYTEGTLDAHSWTPVYPGPPQSGGDNVRTANGTTENASAEVRVPNITPVLFSGWHLGLRADVVTQAVPEYRMWTNQTAEAEVKFKYPGAGLSSPGAVRITSSVSVQ